ncbi:hypothetical protein PR048_007489 [Dryococelus australis]|uniref:Uncharacterized protein n=1 Tax=Dryococelus australis TaxID=614101 RepID=A0ABQ9HUF1_9NEOP|nr:hypothetical protein PR048_007489 [Dryococelus australis]
MFLRRRRQPPPPTNSHLVSHSSLLRILAWHHHISIAVGKAETSFNVLQSLLISICPFSPDTRIKLWRAYIIPILLHGSVVWSYVHPSTFRSIVPTFNVCLYRIVGYPRLTQTEHTYQLGDVESPVETIHWQSARFLAALCHPYPIISSIADYNPTDLRPHRRLLDMHLADPP